MPPKVTDENIAEIARRDRRWCCAMEPACEYHLGYELGLREMRDLMNGTVDRLRGVRSG